MIPLLRNISGKLSRTLIERGTSRVFYTGEQIFTEGEAAHFLPVVLSGKIKMFHFLDDGKEVIVGMFEAGEMFAVPPVFDGKNYPSSAAAMEESRLLLIGREDFLELLRRSNEFAFAVIGWMSEMLREKTATIQNLATASPEQRVGHVLLKLAEKDAGTEPVKIPLLRREIAEMAGLTTETTIRVIRRLAEKKLVTIVHGKIILETVQPLRKHLVA